MYCFNQINFKSKVWFQKRNFLIQIIFNPFKHRTISWYKTWKYFLSFHSNEKNDDRLRFVSRSMDLSKNQVTKLQYFYVHGDGLRFKGCGSMMKMKRKSSSSTRSFGLHNKNILLLYFLLIFVPWNINLSYSGIYT